MNKIHLLVIDPQNDFCKQGGSLFIPGADQDMKNLATMIDRISDKLADIHITMDSHHQWDIAHPIFWKDNTGKEPAPFTQITLSDLEKGNFTTSIPSNFARAKAYVQQLEANGRYPLTEWPTHCVIGTEGHNIVAELMEAVMKWERTRSAMVNFVTKGSNPWTEHYSAVIADVPDPKDPTTQLNVDFIDLLENQADEIAIAGEALSHCVANTIRDIAYNFGNKDAVKKFVLLRDATSPVPGFEKLGEDFITEMTALGMRVSTTTEYLK